MRTSMIAASCSLVFALSGLSSPANAAPVLFNATAMNVDAPGPQSARCGSRFTVNIGNGPNSTATGTSNLGAFAMTASHCIQLPPPVAYDLGQFLFTFASGDTLFGTYSGALTFNAPGVFNLLQTNIVTGGTGLFAGASGMFTGTGIVSFVGGTPNSQQVYAGALELPAVPEPATWAMMIMGFGAIGGTLRRRHIVTTRIGFA